MFLIWWSKIFDIFSLRCINYQIVHCFDIFFKFMQIDVKFIFWNVNFCFKFASHFSKNKIEINTWWYLYANLICIYKVFKCKCKFKHHGPYGLKRIFNSLGIIIYLSNECFEDVFFNKENRWFGGSKLHQIFTT
jgi:hypothetical protein